MRIIADRNIPFLDDYFNDCSQLQLVDRKQINQRSLRDFEVLICRADLKVDQQLLEGTSIKHVLTPCSGIDHLDIDYLDQQSIQWHHAPGCNAIAVAEYVINCIAQLQLCNRLSTQSLKIGVIGAGHVGQQVIDRIDCLGYEVVISDPPRAAREAEFETQTLSAFYDCDVISLHTPLTKQGDHPTRGLINLNFINQLKSGCVIINTSRGEVIAEQVYQTHLPAIGFCYDVYPNEPHIAQELVKNALICTPHIAGHTFEAKWRGTWQIYKQYLSSLNQSTDQAVLSLAPQAINVYDSMTWQQIITQLFDISVLSLALKQAPPAQLATIFTELRRQTLSRFEFTNYYLSGANINEKQRTILSKLGLD